MNAPSEHPRIFVQIASYRDPECQHTVKDLFDKATHPERIFVGICWQFVREEDGICFQVPYPYPDQVRVHEVDARQGRGVCWARSLTQALWQGEEFTLQIDSHMRFEQGWDEILLSMWRQCAHPKAVLTCYPAGYTPPHQIDREWIFGMSAKEFDKDGLFKMVGKPAYKPGNPPKAPMRGAFASACMLFGPASLIQDVPYDPHLYFFGEEITLAVRLWTHGYELFHPNGLMVYHDWDRSKRPTHFSDHKDWYAQNLISIARVKHLVGTQRSSDPVVLAEIARYGLGSVRSLQDYERYSGVDFAARRFTENAANGVFYPLPQPTESQDGRPHIFVRIASYRDPECQWTVKDLFEKATYPERIRVGICWQFDEKDDAHCFTMTTRPDQVRMLPFDWRDSEGVCWARAQAELLLDQETYSLQMDAHMRLIPGWDEFLIQELARCPSPKAVLSVAPASYVAPYRLERDPKLQHARLLSTRAVFSRSELLREVPYDPYISEAYEAMHYAMRLYTHGWEVHPPSRVFAYHCDHAASGIRPSSHAEDMKAAGHAEKLAFLSTRGQARFQHLTGHALSNDPRVLMNIEKYGLGKLRAVADFESWIGGGLMQQQMHDIAAAPVQTLSPPPAVFAIGRERHVPLKVFESRGGVVFDQFLPEALYRSLQDYALTTDYEHINTKGKITRAWHIHDGFPLRSVSNVFYYANKESIPTPKPLWVHPSDNDLLNRFMEFMLEFQPQVERYVGKPGKDGWDHFSVTSWLYPTGTGLAMHDDGSGVYTGAYAFFLNKTWRAHWGGMLLLMDDAANELVHAHRRTIDQVEYHRQKWLHVNNCDELLLEHGLARCIFPKGNRIVFIANDAYHMVTRVNEAAGDNVRVSFAGFFDRTKK